MLTSSSNRLVFGAVAFAVLTLTLPRPGRAQVVTPPPPPAPAQAQTTGPATVPLSLSMDQAVTMALETSLGLKSERMNVDIAAQSIVSAKSAFLPFTTSSFSRNSLTSPSQNFADGTSSITASNSLSATGGIQQRLPWYGNSYQLTWIGNRAETPGAQSSTFNPRTSSTLRLDVSQPLWQGLKIDANRASLERTERQQVISDLQLQQRVVGLEASVRTAYLGYVASIEARKVAQQNMDLAQQSLSNARARVAVGQAPQIDIITSEATVESFREQLILADASIEQTEDNLRSQVLDPNRPDYWQVHIEPTDQIRLTQRQIDEPSIIQNALANRLDLLSLKRSMEITDLNLKLNKDLTKPSVDLQMTYQATGSGGTLTTGQPGRGFGGVLGDAFSGAYPEWTWGVNFGYPLGRSSAQAAVVQNELTKKQQTLNQHDLEIAIVQDVRQAARDVRTTWQRVQATQAARQASERQLDAEQRKFEVGLTDTFTLQSRQRDFASARINELNAIIAYNRSLIELERVQKIR